MKEAAGGDAHLWSVSLALIKRGKSGVARIPTKLQISAGGVAFRRRGGQTTVALVSVGEQARWQLPKGLVDKNESTEAAAIREVREEAGVETEMIAPIEKVEYWYYWKEDDGARVRYHKFVYFFLLRYKSGDVNSHDDEVNEARWVDLDEAAEMLAFASEKKIMERAREMLSSVE
jgi:8-oxo-dGTP pyrophosphatase MutT (NUDIX family)